MWGGKHLFTFVGGGTIGAAQSFASTGDKHIFTIPFRCRPIRAGITITTQTNSTGNVVVKFDHRPTAGSDVSRGDGDVGTITIPSAVAVNKVYYENTDYVAAGTGSWIATANEGDQIVVQCTTAATTAGEGIPWLIVEVDPEQPGNNSAMVAG